MLKKIYNKGFVTSPTFSILHRPKILKHKTYIK